MMKAGVLSILLVYEERCLEKLKVRLELVETGGGYGGSS
jgi:hypothetical protein